MTQLLGKIAADMETQLAAKISVGGTTGTLASATDDDGVALPSGRYFFTIDKGNSKKEHISCSLSGTALTNIKSVSRQGVETSGVAREHRVGANVIISDFAHIKKINDLLDGTTSFDSGTPLGYDGAPSITTGNQLTTKTYVDDSTVGISGDETVAGIKTFSSSPIVPTPTTDYQASTKKYVDDTAFAGAPNASTTVKGIVEIATQAEVDVGTDTGGTGAFLSVLPSQLATVNAKSLTAGEALTAGDAVYVAAGTESALISSSTTNTVRETNSLIYQSFVTGPNATKIFSVTMLWDTNGGASSADLTLRTTPAGSNMFTPVSTGTGNQNGEFNFVIPGGVTVTPNTTYYIVCNGNFRGGTTSSYPSGVSGYWNGSTWITPAPNVTGDFYFKVFEGYTIAGQVYKTSANSALYTGGNWTTGFIGFAKSTVSSGASVSVQMNGVYAALSGLTAGLTYYLSNTLGTIASSAGTVSKKIGLSLSTTSLLIKHDN